jgi:hypothetical protein
VQLSIPEATEAEAGGTPVIGYDLQIDDGHYGPWRYVLGGNRSANTLATTVFLTAEEHGLEGGLIYRVRYRVINSIGEGPWSDTAYVRAATLPQAPPSPVVASVAADRIVLELSPTPDDGDSAGGSAFRYHLHANEGDDGSPFHKITAYDGASLTYTLVSGDPIGASGKVFEAGRIYSVKLTAENEVGDSELRYPAPITRVALGRAPAQPQQPVVDVAGSSETVIKLDWPAPAPTDSLPLTRYLIYSDLGVPGNAAVVHNSTAMNVLSFTHRGLTPGGLYSYWL